MKKLLISIFTILVILTSCCGVDNNKKQDDKQNEIQHSQFLLKVMFDNNTIDTILVIIPKENLHLKKGCITYSNGFTDESIACGVRYYKIIEQKKVTIKIKN